MEVAVFQTVARQLIERRRGDWPAERARRAEPQVVNEDDHDVGRTLGRLDLETRRRRHLARVDFLINGRLGLGDRQNRSIDSVGGVFARPAPLRSLLAPVSYEIEARDFVSALERAELLNELEPNRADITQLLAQLKRRAP